jgi:hypothetical protein
MHRRVPPPQPLENYNKLGNPRPGNHTSIAGQSAQPTAEPKLRDLPRAGFATANNTHALRTVKYRYAPFAGSMLSPCASACRQCRHRQPQ